MQTEITILMARGVVWQAVSLGLRRPDELIRARLASRDGLAALGEAAGAIDRELARRVDALAETGGPSSDDHARLFGHTSRGQVPPYETEWGRDDIFLKPHRLSDLMGYLDAFGLRIDPEAHERVDHLGCQAELSGFLAAKQARSLEEGDAEAAAVAGDARRRLLADHLARFAPAFARALARADERGFYGRLGGLLGEIVANECTHAGVEPGDPVLTLRPTEIDDQGITCGDGNELIQIQRSNAPAGGS